MPHTVAVDLSAKVEQWTKDTAVAFADGIHGSILVESRVKQEARAWLRRQYPNRRPSFYQYLLFASFVYLLVQPYLDGIERIVIDRDYPGKQSEQEIKSWLFHFARREASILRADFISFYEVRGSRADVLARGVYRGNEEAERILSLNDIQRLLR